MIVEVIATTLGEAKVAQNSGANRIELVSGLAEGGLTPSYGLIDHVIQSVHIPVQVMIRPHSQSFHYHADDVKTMIEDVLMVKRLAHQYKASERVGIVVGVLDEQGMIDEQLLQIILREAGEMDVTFHRAFDEVKDQFEALELLAKYPQIQRVLTSGGQHSALDAVPRIKSLVKVSQDTNVKILAGSGLTIANVASFAQDTEVEEVHFGSGIRSGESGKTTVDAAKVQAVLDELKNIA